MSVDKNGNMDILMQTNRYREAKPHRVKLVFWSIVNSIVFRLAPMRLRKALTRWFGVKGRFACHLYPSVKIYAPWNLTVGSWVCLGPRIELYNKGEIVIGDYVTISQGAFLCTASHDISSPTMDLVTKPIKICNQAWIAANATILPGVTIGEGAVVGACAVVSKDVPPWTVVVGNPARVVGKRDIKPEQ